MENNEYKAVKVWDWQTRILHWFNAILIITLAILAFGFEIAKELGMPKQGRGVLKEIHAIIGYFFVATFTLRILWGFLGNEYARWGDIIPYHREKWQMIGSHIKWYLSGFKAKPPIIPGHNPVASLFYIFLFIILISQVITGLTLAGLAFDFFPGSLFFSGWSEGAKEALEDVAEEIHEFGFFFIILFLVAHIGGLVVHEIGEKTGLFSSMIHGRKYLPKDGD
ncbi:MAG: cytochrome b/b6 domain-containing protein [Deltaproteobacteria bacterium]|nr:cytochrome b/b6 domain-containing protein [Deltaproteobacteria bacterium]